MVVRSFVTEESSHPGLRRSHLRIVETEDVPRHSGAMMADVLAARRDMARLLRSLHLAGKTPASWPHEILTRLAHADATTARYVLDEAPFDALLAERTTLIIRTIESWIYSGLTRGEHKQIKQGALTIRISDDDLAKPLLPTDWLESLLDAPAPAAAHSQSLTLGLRTLTTPEVETIAARLGVNFDGLFHGTAAASSSVPETSDPASSAPSQRSLLERAIIHTLEDGHLLGILLATLPPSAHRLLALLIREPGSSALDPELQAVVKPDHPFQLLRACGLVYFPGSAQAVEAWVPVELHRRVDGILRALGV